MIFAGNETQRINEIIKSNSLTRLQVIEKEILKFKTSKKRKTMIDGDRYYKGIHDILERKRTVIGKDGNLSEVSNLPNNKIVDNQYARLVDQKCSYLLSKPFTIKCENTELLELLNSIFNNDFFRILKDTGEDCLNCGSGYIYIYTKNGVDFKFKRFEPYNIIPFYKDSEHRELDCIVRLFYVSVYEGDREIIKEKAEIYTDKGIERYFIKNTSLVFEESEYYLSDTLGNVFNLNYVPVIPFKLNSKEIPLISRVKKLQDSLNIIESDFMNNMQEDARNTILVLKNYDGTNLEEFRYNLAKYGAVKVKSIDGAVGDIQTLKVNVDSGNYKVIADMLKRSIMENARGIDSKDDRLTGNVTRMNIQSVYSDIDLDANIMECEFQWSISKIIELIGTFIKIRQNTFPNCKADIVFNRDILINETESIENCIKSTEILSQKSIIEQHPWVKDITAELKRLDEQYEKNKKSQNPQIFNLKN